MDDIKKARLLLEKYRRDRCSDDEKKIIQSWYDKIDFSQLGEPSDWNALEEKLESAILSRIQIEEKNKTRLFRLPAYKYIVAACIMAFFITVGSYLSFVLETRKAHSGTTMNYEVYNNKQTPRLVSLPDGTKVWLNACSKLRWSDDFGKQYRKVVLKGEGYFEVEKDKDRPFIVATGAVNTKVTGTAFNVEAYDGENRVRVALLQGSVELSNKDISTKVLQPGETGLFIDGTRQFDIQKEDVAKYRSWMNGKIDYENLPLRDILERLCRRFDYKIKWDTPKPDVMEKTINFHFDNNQNGTDIISSLLYINHINFSIEQKTIIIKP